MTAAAIARMKAGLSLEEAAKRARVCSAYLRRIERSGGCSYPLAVRLARLYRCSANVFLYRSKGSETPGSRKKSTALARAKNSA
jgi:transcriptional regulator with XRE-family HTH domain